MPETKRVNDNQANITSVVFAFLWKSQDRKHAGHDHKDRACGKSGQGCLRKEKGWMGKKDELARVGAVSLGCVVTIGNNADALHCFYGAIEAHCEIVCGETGALINHRLQ